MLMVVESIEAVVAEGVVAAFRVFPLVLGRLRWRALSLFSLMLSSVVDEDADAQALSCFSSSSGSSSSSSSSPSCSSCSLSSTSSSSTPRLESATHCRQRRICCIARGCLLLLVVPQERPHQQRGENHGPCHYDQHAHLFSKGAAKVQQARRGASSKQQQRIQWPMTECLCVCVWSPWGVPGARRRGGGRCVLSALWCGCGLRVNEIVCVREKRGCSVHHHPHFRHQRSVSEMVGRLE